MANYKIADITVKINPKYESTKNQLSDYITDSEIYDFEITVADAEILEMANQSELKLPYSQYESTIILRKLCDKLLESYNGFFFHSSSLMLNGEGYVFTALSGTGKSTHTALWRKHFGDKVIMINDDKPMIRKVGNDFFIYGTPWMGKSNIGNNVRSSVKAVYILKRSEKNSVKRVSVGQVFKEILEATVVPAEKELMITLLSLLDEFFTKTPVYILNCNISDEAVTTAYNAVN